MTCVNCGLPIELVVIGGVGVWTHVSDELGSWSSTRRLCKGVPPSDGVYYRAWPPGRPCFERAPHGV